MRNARHGGDRIWNRVSRRIRLLAHLTLDFFYDHCKTLTLNSLPGLPLSPRNAPPCKTQNTYTVRSPCFHKPTGVERKIKLKKRSLTAAHDRRQKPQTKTHMHPLRHYCSALLVHVAQSCPLSHFLTETFRSLRTGMLLDARRQAPSGRGASSSTC
jgi:hypothetical protein